MSDVEFVLFQARARLPCRPRGPRRPHRRHLARLRLRRAFNEATISARSRHHEANFGKLMLGRIDLAITDRRSGITCSGSWACNSKSRNCRW
jgi:polar amino acid transport system substrate-binding protein